MRYRIIVNPVAGRGASLKAVPQVKALLNRQGLPFDVVVTERPWHAAQLAQDAVAQGFDVVVAMGGDGTANEVINGLMRTAEQGPLQSALGVLCVGRGNDFAFGAGIPRDLEEGCRILAQGKKRRIDVGRVTVDDSSESRYFGNGIGIGFDTVVGFEAAKMKHLQGFLSYLVAALKTLFFLFRALKIQIDCDGKAWDQSSLMVSVMNGRRMGGGFLMAPEAESDDGLLDFCIAGVAGRMRLLFLMTRFMKGTQGKSKIITTGRTVRISITALEGTLPAHADGETLCTEGRKLDVELLKNRLDVICPSAE